MCPRRGLLYPEDLAQNHTDRGATCCVAGKKMKFWECDQGPGNARATNILNPKPKTLNLNSEPQNLSPKPGTRQRVCYQPTHGHTLQPTRDPLRDSCPPSPPVTPMLLSARKDRETFRKDRDTLVVRPNSDARSPHMSAHRLPQAHAGQNMSDQNLHAQASALSHPPSPCH